MSGQEGPIGRDNMSTVVAVAAVTAILALAYGVYLNRQIQVVAVGAAALDMRAARRDVAFEKQLEALQLRIDVLEAAGPPAADPVATAGAGADAVPAEAAPN